MITNVSSSSPMHEQQEAREKLKKLIEGIDFAMFTTLDEEGQLRSRPMSTLQFDEKEGMIWFFSGDNSPKTSEILEDSQVNLAYADPKGQRYVSVSGVAQVSYDKNKMAELWNSLHRAWFPQGLEDPHLCLIGVEIEKAEYWDSPSSKMVQVVGFLKAIATGEPLKRVGDHQKLRM